MLFLADVPDQVRVLTIYGKLKMGFKNASGEDVVFDVLEVPATQPGSLKPTATIMNPATAGGSSAVTTAQSYIDVLFTAPKGGGLDLDSIMQMVTKITLHRGASQFSFTDITPMSLIEVDGVLAYVPLRRVGNDILRGTEVVAKRCADTKTCDLPATATDYELMLAAVRKTNTTYFRFSLASPVWTVGDYSVTITAGAVKGLDGSTNDALEFQFGLDGATARLSDPGAGGTIDINVLNQRNWIDVAFVAPGSGLRPGRRLDRGPRTRVRARGRRPRHARTRPVARADARVRDHVPVLAHGQAWRRRHHPHVSGGHVGLQLDDGGRSDRHGRRSR